MARSSVSSACVSSARLSLTGRQPASEASTEMSTLPRMALEIGQPASPCAARSANPAWSSPGTTPCTLSELLPTLNPPAGNGSNVTDADTRNSSGGCPASASVCEKAMA